MRPLVVAIAAVLVLALLPWGAPPAAALSPHGPIVASGDGMLAGLAASEGWPGSGAPGDPIVISGLSIHAPGHAIHLHATTLWVRIANNHLSAGAFAVALDRASNVEILSNVLEGATYGVWSHAGHEVVVAGNQIRASSDWGVLAWGGSGWAVTDNRVLGGATGWGLGFGTTQDLVVARNRVEYVPGTAISVSGTSAALVEANLVTAPGLFGIVVSSDGTPAHDVVVRGNTVTRTGLSGIVAQANGAPLTGFVVEDNVLSDLWLTGIGIVGTTGTIVRGNQLSQAHHNGIVAGWEATGILVEDNAVTDSGHTVSAYGDYRVGIGLVFGAQGTVQDNTVLRIGGVAIHGAHVSDSAYRRNVATWSPGGILLDGQSTPGATDRNVIEGNLVEHTSVFGVAAFSTDGTIIGDNVVRDGGVYGLVVDGSRNRASTANVVRDNLVEIAQLGIVEGGPLASGNLVERNVVRHTAVGGLWTAGGSGPATFRDNDVTHAGLAGVVVAGRSHVLFERTTVTGGTFGILVGDDVQYGVQATADAFLGNVLDGATYAVWLAGGGGHLLADNELRAVGEWGVTEQLGGGNTIVDNSIAGARRAIVMSGSVGSTVARNTIDGNRGDVALLVSGSGHAVESNLIAGSVGIGAFLLGTAADVTFAHNRVLGSGSFGIAVQNGGGLVYDNSFVNRFNAIAAGSSAVWNVPRTPGTNVVGGAFLAGNHWSDLVGLDLDNDGVSELPYLVLPLVADLDARTVEADRLQATINMPLFDHAPLMPRTANVAGLAGVVVGPVTGESLDPTLLDALGPNAAAPAPSLPQLDVDAETAAVDTGVLATGLPPLGGGLPTLPRAPPA